MVGVSQAHCDYFAAQQRRVHCTRAPGSAGDSARRGIVSSWRLGSSSCRCTLMVLGRIHRRWGACIWGVGIAQCARRRNRGSAAPRAAQARQHASGPWPGRQVHRARVSSRRSVAPRVARCCKTSWALPAPDFWGWTRPAWPALPWRCRRRWHGTAPILAAATRCAPRLLRLQTGPPPPHRGDGRRSV